MNSLIRVVIVLLISALSASEEVRVSVSQPQNLLSAEQAVNVLADKIGSELAAKGGKEAGREEPTANSGQNRREEQKDQSDADQTFVHG